MCVIFFSSVLGGRRLEDGEPSVAVDFVARVPPCATETADRPEIRRAVANVSFQRVAIWEETGAIRRVVPFFFRFFFSLNFFFSPSPPPTLRSCLKRRFDRDSRPFTVNAAFVAGDSIRGETFHYRRDVHEGKKNKNKKKKTSKQTKQKQRKMKW